MVDSVFLFRGWVNITEEEPKLQIKKKKNTPPLYARVNSTSTDFKNLLEVFISRKSKRFYPR